MQKFEEGKQLYREQKFEEAVVLLTDFLNQNPNHADGLFFRGVCYRKLDLYPESINDFNGLLTKLPDEPTLLCERAISLFKNQQLELAMVDLNKAVDLDKNNPYRYSSRAFIRANIDVEGAIKDYQKAIELDPKDEIAYNNLGLLQEHKGNYKEAQENFKKSNQIIGYKPEERTIEQTNSPIEIEGKTYHNSWQLLMGILTTSSVRKEYFNFIKNYFKH